jgi:phage shock protein E
MTAMRLYLLGAALMLATPLYAQAEEPKADNPPQQVSPPWKGSPLIDYQGHIKLAKEAGAHREKRLIGWQEFQKRAAKPQYYERHYSIILDTRDRSVFAAGHIKGAINLPLPDFDEGSLMKILGVDMGGARTLMMPLYEREILLYNGDALAGKPSTEEADIPLPLQSFIALYGYGYTNIYELNEAPDKESLAAMWEGKVGREIKRSTPNALHARPNALP